MHAVLGITCLVVLVYAQSVAHARAQDIVATPIAKQPPSQIPGGGIQIDIQNRTKTLQRVKVREPGGNWYVFTFPPQGGLNLRCISCSQGFEATLPGEPQLPSLLLPGTEYEIRQRSSRERVVLQPRGGDGGRH